MKTNQRKRKAKKGRGTLRRVEVWVAFFMGGGFAGKQEGGWLGAFSQESQGNRKRKGESGKSQAYPWENLPYKKKRKVGTQETDN